MIQVRLAEREITDYAIGNDRGSQLGFLLISQTLLCDVDWGNAAGQRQYVHGWDKHR